MKDPRNYGLKLGNRGGWDGATTVSIVERPKNLTNEQWGELLKSKMLEAVRDINWGSFTWAFINDKGSLEGYGVSLGYSGCEKEPMLWRFYNCCDTEHDGLYTCLKR